MSDIKHIQSSSEASQDKLDVEKHDEIHVPGLNVRHVHELDNDLKDAEVKEARNAAFAAAVSAGGTDPWSKAAFVIYACTLSSIPHIVSLAHISLTGC